MRSALAAGIACFNVESEAELDVLNEVALAEGRRAPVSIRVNPNVDPKTHPYISTGLKGNKFGIAHDRAVEAYRACREAAGPGSGRHRLPHRLADHRSLALPGCLDRVLDLVEAIEAAGVPIHHIDFGGGLGIDYNGDTPPRADDLWQQLLAKLDARGFGRRKLMIEPGRSLVGNAGVCVTEVLYLKPGEQKNFCIVDAAMNDLPRPAMYQAFQRIVPVRTRAGDAPTYDVVGPVCESGDWIGRDRALWWWRATCWRCCRPARIA
jgi:diaminopimelate decarboxylase